jgi:nucleoid-associated protein YgaU
VLDGHFSAFPLTYDNIVTQLPPVPGDRPDRQGGAAGAGERMTEPGTRSKDGGTGAGRKALAAGLAVAVLAALLLLARSPSSIPGPPVPADPSVEAAASAAPEEAPAAEAPPVAATAPPPAFDLVRVAPDGAAVIAGRAAPGSHVTIYADNAPLAEVEADASGTFVAVFTASPATSPRALTLEAEDEAGARTASEDVVMLLPGAPEAAAGPQAEDPDPAAAAPLPATAAAPAGSAGDDAGGAGSTGAGDAAAADGGDGAGEAAAEIAAVAVVRDEAVEVRQTEEPADEAGPAQVALAGISYTETGAVTISGRGSSGALLRAYVDGALVREASVGADGRWLMELPGLAAGRYRLRVDEIGDDGRVASRVETPFQRDFPPAPARRPGAPGPDAQVTVQPGGNLWTIARLQYGSGVLYTQIFAANSELIRDPDLIYPGQVLAVPDIDRAQ